MTERQTKGQAVEQSRNYEQLRRTIEVLRAVETMGESTASEVYEYMSNEVMNCHPRTIKRDLEALVLAALIEKRTVKRFNQIDTLGRLQNRMVCVYKSIANFSAST